MSDDFALEKEFWSGLFNWRNIFEYDVSLILAAICAFTLIILMWRRLRQIAHTTRAHYDWARKDNVLDYSISRAKAYHQAQYRLTTIFGGIYQPNTIPISVINDAIENNPSVLVDLNAMFGHFDNLAIAIDQDIVDHKICFLMMSEPVCGACHTFEEFIEEASRKNPMSYRHLRKLMKVWRPMRAERRKSMRQNRKMPYSKLDAPLRL